MSRRYSHKRKPWLIELSNIIANVAIWLSDCASRACWTLDVVSVTVRTPRRSSPPPVCLSIRPPPSTQRGAGECQDACECVWGGGGIEHMLRIYIHSLIRSNGLMWNDTFQVELGAKLNECASLLQVLQLQPDERSDLLGLQLLSHLLLLAGLTGSGALPGCFRSR